MTAAMFAIAFLSAPPAVGETATAFELESVSGDPVTLDSLRKDGPVAVIVLRGYPGYQCPLCSRQFGEFVRNAGAFAEAKTDLVFIYPADASLGAEGTRSKAREFLRNAKLPANVHVLLDPGYTFTDAYDLRWNAPRETAYPSTFVIDSDGTVAFAKVSTGHAGRSAASVVLENAKKAAD